MVHLGADACIIGRNVEKTESMAKSIATARSGAKVIGIGAIDVRSIDSLMAAVDRCVAELGGIDFVMYVASTPDSPGLETMHRSIVYLWAYSVGSAGAAGNFLATINQLSANAFKSVIDIDVLGSYNTLKATIPHLVKSAEKHKSDGRTGGFPFSSIKTNSYI